MTVPNRKSSEGAPSWAPFLECSLAHQAGQAAEVKQCHHRKACRVIWVRWKMLGVVLMWDHGPTNALCP